MIDPRVLDDTLEDLCSEVRGLRNLIEIVRAEYRARQAYVAAEYAEERDVDTLDATMVAWCEARDKSEAALAALEVNND